MRIKINKCLPPQIKNYMHSIIQKSYSMITTETLKWFIRESWYHVRDLLLCQQVWVILMKQIEMKILLRNFKFKAYKITNSNNKLVEIGIIIILIR